MHGISRGKTVPARHATPEREVQLYSGTLGLGPRSRMTFPDEVKTQGCGNLALLPDWDTLKVLPWAGRGGVTARVICEQKNWSGVGALQTVPRTVCRRQLDKLKRMGLLLLSAVELEFSLCKPPLSPAAPTSVGQPAFKGVDVTATLQLAKSQELVYEVEQGMRGVGVDIETMHAEKGEGQLEIVYAPEWGIKSPDQTFTFKTGVKEICTQRGLHATFMTKPFVSGAANGGHFNHSVWHIGDGGVGSVNAFYTASCPTHISEFGRFWLAGILKHSRALQALCAPTTNCYYRVADWTWAPTQATWGIDNRTASVRVKDDNERGTYYEVRQCSSAANPYLVTAGVIAAGMLGIQMREELPPMGDSDCYSVEGAEALPRTLSEALDALEADTQLCDALGEQFVKWYLQLKREEMQEAPNGALWNLAGQEDRDDRAAWENGLYGEFL